MRDIFSDSLRQLNKLSIYKPMQYRITEIDIDFSDSLDDITQEEQNEVIDEVMATTWEAVDADDLVEEITAATGWCVNSIDYCYVLQ
tara:strand:- start:426 stop:686 length:261 start_codon:yes stop_codon:yes gene_type:complete